MIPLSFLHFTCTLHTLLDVIPLRYHSPMHHVMHCPASSRRAPHMFCLAQKGSSVESSNVQANFLCLQLMTTVNRTLIITKRQTGSSPLTTCDKLRASILPTRRATQWPAPAVCHQFTTVSTILHLLPMLRAFPFRNSRSKTKKSAS